MTNIHPTAQVHSKAQIAEGVTIGPYTIVDEHVTIGKNTKLSHHVTVTGRTTLGENNNIFPYAVIGTAPQDITFKGEPTQLVMGDNNTIREFVTINLGTNKEHGRTQIGNHNLFMAYCHIAHDCVLGNHIIVANGLQLGGHVRIYDYAAFGGQVGIHHFVTVGQYSFVGGMARVIQDVPPFMIMEGHPARVRGLNVIGLERHGFSEEQIKALKEAYKIIWHSSHTQAEALKILEGRDQTPEVKTLVQFLQQMQAGPQARASEAFRKIPARPVRNAKE